MEQNGVNQRRSRVLTTPPRDRQKSRSGTRQSVGSWEDHRSHSRSRRRRHDRVSRRRSRSHHNVSRRSRSAHSVRRRPRSHRNGGRRSRSAHAVPVSRGTGRAVPASRGTAVTAARDVIPAAKPRRRRHQQRGAISSTNPRLVEALRTLGDKSSNEKLSNQNTVPEFDPARKEQTVAMWIHKVNECAVIYNWTNRQTVHFALPKLKGLAQKWYAGLSTVMFSWQEWQEKLLLAFPCDDNYGLLLTAMFAKRARFNDSLEEYFYDKMILLNRCEIIGKRAVDCIVLGIDDRSVRLGAEAARFESPDQLLPFLKSAKNSAYVDRKVRSRNDVKLEVGNKGTTSDRPIRCFNCSQEGHYKSQCPKPVVKCDKCMRFGHTTDNCRSNGKLCSSEQEVV